MADVSILLNLTVNLSLEDTDPFMSLVAEKRGGAEKESLLFYDQLSVRRFPTERSLYSSYLDSLLCDLRTLLESRSLSTLDRGGDIRLIVTMDLANGLFEPEDRNKFCFPAQKVRLFKEKMVAVFGDDNPMNSRFRYNFIFLESTLPSTVKLATFYRSAAFNGITGDVQEWLSEDRFGIDPKPNIMDAIPDEDAQIEKIPAVCAYLDGVKKVFNDVSALLDKAGAGQEFLKTVMAEIGSIKIWKDFINADFKAILRSAVSRAIGLANEDFQKNHNFFLIKFTGSPAAIKRRDETYLFSLILLLITISDTEYKNLFNNGAGSVFIGGGVKEDDFDQEQLFKLYECIRHCSNRLKESGDVRQKKDGRVSYKEYSSRTQKPSETDTHTSLNSKIENEEKALYGDFERKRRVPFFFGDRLGDWAWWIGIKESLDSLCQHEKENSRPYHDPPRRISDKEMSFTEKECSYSEMESIVDRLKETEAEAAFLPAADINEYLNVRTQRIAEFEEACAKMKEQMKKLGYLHNGAWLTVFFTLAMTLCYSFHFWARKGGENPIWILAGLSGAFVVFLIGMCIARSRIKQSIETSILEIGKVYAQLKEDRSNYLEMIENKAKEQIDADIRRKNISELQEKLNAFHRHNLQADKWETFFNALLDKMGETFDLLGLGRPEMKDTLKLNDAPFAVDGFPSIPSELTHSFREEKIAFSCFGSPITDVVCFVKRFEFTRK